MFASILSTSTELLFPKSSIKFGQVKQQVLWHRKGNLDIHFYCLASWRSRKTSARRTTDLHALNTLNPSEAGARGETREERADVSEKELCKAALSKAKAGDREGAITDLKRLAKQYPNNSRFLVSAARLTGQQGRTDQARDLFSQAAASTPHDLVPLKAWGLMESRLGRSDRARELFRRAAEVGEGCGERGDLLCHWAEEERRAGDIRRARELLEEARQEAKLAGNAPNKALHALAMLEAGLGNQEEARLLFSQGAEEGSEEERPAFFAAWARLEWQRGEVATARELFQRGDRECQPCPILLTSWAGLEAKAANVSAARKLYNKALATDHSHQQAILGLATLEGRSRNHGKAAELYDRGLQADPRNPHLMHARAQMLIKQGLHQEAEDALESMLRIHPEHSFALHTLGTLKLLSGGHQQAFVLFTRGLNSRGADVEGRRLCLVDLAKLHEFDLQIKAARSCFRRAVALPPGQGHSRALREFASFEKRHGDLEGAKRLFRASHAANPGDNRTLLQWALLEKRRQDWEAARSLFRKGAANVPHDAFIYQAWALMEKQAGNYDGARQVFIAGSRSCRGNMPLLLERALFEMEEGNVGVARKLFQSGIRPEQPPHPPLVQAYAQFEMAAGNHAFADSLFQKYEAMLEDGKAQDRRSIQ